MFRPYNIFVRPILLRRLIRKFGPNDTKIQLKWIQQELLPMETKSRPSMTGIIYRLLRDEPLAYVLGTQPFGSLALEVRQPVLIPRPETEEWTCELLDRIVSEYSTREGGLQHGQQTKILDLCTGTGCIPLLICKEWPSRMGSVVAHGVDVSEQAVLLSRSNAKRAFDDASTAPLNASTSVYQNSHGNGHGISTDVNDEYGFHSWQMDIMSPDFEHWLQKHGPFDIITSNPPYIPRSDWDTLPLSVKNFEDPSALLGGPDPDGLTFYRRIAQLLLSENAKPPLPFLSHDGRLVVEVGQGQATSVKELLERTGCFSEIDIWTDASGVERTLFCRAI